MGMVVPRLHSFTTLVGKYMYLFLVTFLNLALKHSDIDFEVAGGLSYLLPEFYPSKNKYLIGASSQGVLRGG